jgi:hypothetical protein
MKTLIIRDGLIENIGTGAGDVAAPSGYEFIVVDDDFRAGVGWDWDGAIATDPTPPPTPEPVADWDGFKSAFLNNANWLAIASQLPDDLRLGGIAASAGLENAPLLQKNYLLAMGYLQALGGVIDPQVIAEWQEIATLYNIPITF